MDNNSNAIRSKNRPVLINGKISFVSGGTTRTKFTLTPYPGSAYWSCQFCDLHILHDIIRKKCFWDIFPHVLNTTMHGPKLEPASYTKLSAIVKFDELSAAYM